MGEAINHYDKLLNCTQNTSIRRQAQTLLNKLSNYQNMVHIKETHFLNFRCNWFNEKLIYMFAVLLQHPLLQVTKCELHIHATLLNLLEK